MARLVCRHLFAVQFIFIAVTCFSVEVNGILSFGSLGKAITAGPRTVARGLTKFPHMVLDGSQYATHKIGGTVSNVVGSVKPLKTAVDTTSGAVSNVFGSMSRLLGKPLVPPSKVMFLFKSQNPLSSMGSQDQQEAARMVLGYVLTNVVLYSNDMETEGVETMDTMPRLAELIDGLRNAGADQADLEDIAKVLSRNYRLDVPEDIDSKVQELLMSSTGKLKNNGFMRELRFIAANPYGYYRLSNKDRTEYKLNTNNKYKDCIVLRPPDLRDTN